MATPPQTATDEPATFTVLEGFDFLPLQHISSESLMSEPSCRPEVWVGSHTIWPTQRTPPSKAWNFPYASHIGAVAGAFKLTR